MNIEQVAEFFKWATIINVALFMVNAILILALGKTLYRMHGKIFGISEENARIAVIG